MNAGSAISLSLVGTFLILLLLGVGMWGCPQYRVYQQTLEGEAELKRAEQNRQIAVQEAQAGLEAADLWAQAEVARAYGVAEANEIIADGLGGADGYLRYLWIQGINGQDGQIVYVPTEAGLPILEAQRLARDEILLEALAND